MRTIFWSEFNRWIECQQRWDYEYPKGRGRHFEPTPEMAEGTLIGTQLAIRLRDVRNYKPPRLAGVTQVLREYHLRYSIDMQRDWRAEVARTRNFNSDIELACVIDGLSTSSLPQTGMVRETKVTDNPNWRLYQQQLMWNCFCAEVSEGELDILLRPGYMRPDWAYQRESFHFTLEDFFRFDRDVKSFLAATYDPVETFHRVPPVRNGHACKYCPFQQDCWEHDGSVLAPSIGSPSEISQEELEPLP